MRSGLTIALTAVLLVAVPGLGSAAAPSPVPEKALAEMAYRVGEWTSTGFTDGVEQPEPAHEITRWDPGKYCITIRGHFVEDGVTVHMTGLVGWDAGKKQLVEHWYASDGSYATFRYSLEEKKDAWVGRFAWTNPDGSKLEGPSIVEKKGPDHWEWNASYMRDGQKHTWRAVNRRVTRERQTAPSGEQ